MCAIIFLALVSKASQLEGGRTLERKCNHHHGLHRVDFKKAWFD